jgi:hypothetical protein
MVARLASKVTAASALAPAIRKIQPTVMPPSSCKAREHIWLASFIDYDLGYFDDETCRLEPLQNPFGAKVLPMSPV